MLCVSLSLHHGTSLQHIVLYAVAFSLGSCEAFVLLLQAATCQARFWAHLSMHQVQNALQHCFSKHTMHRFAMQSPPRPDCLHHGKVAVMRLTMSPMLS